MALTQAGSQTSPEPSRTRIPALWLLPAYLFGLGLVFLGERILGAIDSARYGLVGLGLVAALGATLLRFALARSETGERRRVETSLAAFSALGLSAVLVYFATGTEKGRALLGIASAAAETRARVDGAATVAWIAMLVVALPPLVLGEAALAPMRRTLSLEGSQPSPRPIEARRVSSAVLAGLTLAFAAVYCALFTYAAGELEQKADFSYYRTAKPGSSTRNIVASLNEPIKVIAFFPQLNEVGIEVEGYLKELRGASPNLTLELQDRLLVPALAKDAKVTQDGVIVLSRATARETVVVGSDMKTAASKLKVLDGDFQKALLKVLRTQRTAYLTVGHGELNTQTDAAAEQNGRTTKTLKKLLESQNYAVKELGLAQGLGTDVPSDAHLVMVIGPGQALLPEEIDTLRRYGERGGKLLLALDPDGKPELAPLAGAFDLSWEPVVLANDKVYIRRRYNDSDKALIVTNRFSSHAAVSTLSRNASRAPVVFPGAAPLDKKPGATANIDFAVRALPETFDDRNGNFTFDAPAEKRSSYNLAAAITKPAAGAAAPGKGKDKDANEMRAFVLGDADALSDAAIGNEPNLVLLLDVVRWLGGEESFAGEIQSTEDVKIEHTKQKDLLWFYGLILGAPALVLGGGILYSRRARRPARRDA